jgi:hypothetical protein
LENQVQGAENDASEHEDEDVAKDDSVTVTNSEAELKKTVVIGNQVEPSRVTAAKNEVLDRATSQIIPSSDDDSVTVTVTNSKDEDAEEQGEAEIEKKEKKENPNPNTNPNPHPHPNPNTNPNPNPNWRIK